MKQQCMGLMWQLKRKQLGSDEQDKEEIATGYRIPAKLLHDPDPLDRMPNGGLQDCQYYDEIKGMGTLIKRCSAPDIIQPCKSGRSYGEVAYSAVGQWRNASCYKDLATDQWSCPGIVYTKMVVESLDPDSATRQVKERNAASSTCTYINIVWL